MKIFAAGISTETNTFCPLPTTLEDFRIQRGSDVRAGKIEHPSLNLEDIWGTMARSRSAAFVFGLMAYAEPGGTTSRQAYEALRDEILRELQAALPVDVVLLMLHGAMVAQGYDDCEEDIIRHVRILAGPHAVIGVELDLHCHLRQSTIADADIVITYKEYPHVDTRERAKEVFDLAIATKLGQIRPKMALFDCHMIGLYPTTLQPLRGLIDDMQEAERRRGVLSISFGHGFQFADVPHVGAKVLAITDGDAMLAQDIAREFGQRLYRSRAEIGFERLALDLEDALSRAIASRATPVVVADQSDNTGTGAPGDATFALRWLIDHNVSEAALAIHYDPEVVKLATKVGVGGTLAVRLGGKVSRFSGEPVDLTVEVLAIRPQYLHGFPQRDGQLWLFHAGTVVALRSNGTDIIVSSERCQCFAPSIFTDFGIDPARKKILIVKSTQHFYGAFAPIAGAVIYMAAPGAVAPDPRKIIYRRLDTTLLYPWAQNPLPA